MKTIFALATSAVVVLDQAHAVVVDVPETRHHVVEVVEQTIGSEADRLAQPRR